MVSFLVNLWLSFAAGLFAPIAAVCVLPLYPAFLSYLASQLSSVEAEAANIKSSCVISLTTTSRQYFSI